MAKPTSTPETLVPLLADPFPEKLTPNLSELTGRQPFSDGSSIQYHQGGEMTYETPDGKRQRYLKTGEKKLG